MPRTRSLAWSELKIGILAVVALVLASVLIFMLSGESGFFWQRYSLKTMFGDVAGLKAGAPVRVAGVEVGAVSDVDFVGDRVEVVMEIKKEHQPRITTAVAGDARLGVAARRGGGRHHRRRARARRSRSGATSRPGRARCRSRKSARRPARGSVEATELLKDIRDGPGHARQAGHRRGALPRARARCCSRRIAWRARSRTARARSDG